MGFASANAGRTVAGGEDVGDIVTPTIANGEVYAATADGVAVFGGLANAGLPQLAGSWFINGDEATRIHQNGSSLTFTNEPGNPSPGTFLRSTRVVATG